MGYQAVVMRCGAYVVPMSRLTSGGKEEKRPAFITGEKWKEKGKELPIQNTNIIQKTRFSKFLT